MCGAVVTKKCTLRTARQAGTAMSKRVRDHEEWRDAANEPSADVAAERQAVHGHRHKQRRDRKARRGVGAFVRALVGYLLDPFNWF